MARTCKGCDRNINHMHLNAKFHSRRCKDRYWNRVNPRGFGRSLTAKAADGDGDAIADLDHDPGWDGHKDTF